MKSKQTNQIGSTTNIKNSVETNEKKWTLHLADVKVLNSILRKDLIEIFKEMREVLFRLKSYESIPLVYKVEDVEVRLYALDLIGEVRLIGNFTNDFILVPLDNLNHSFIVQIYEQMKDTFKMFLGTERVDKFGININEIWGLEFPFDTVFLKLLNYSPTEIVVKKEIVKKLTKKELVKQIQEKIINEVNLLPYESRKDTCSIHFVINGVNHYYTAFEYLCYLIKFNEWNTIYNFKTTKRRLLKNLSKTELTHMLESITTSHAKITNDEWKKLIELNKKLGKEHGGN